MDIIMASPPRGLKMAIVLWSDAPIYDYALPTWRLNCMYGRRHGIDVIRSSKKRWRRHAMWERVPLLRQYLPHYDYVMWVDADAAFSPWAPDIRDLVLAHDLPDALVTEDCAESVRQCAFQEGRSDADMRASNLNSGVVIVRNSAGGYALLDSWSNEEFRHWDDQSFLRLVYLEHFHESADMGRVVKMLYGEVQWFPRKFMEEVDTAGFLQACCTEHEGFIWHLAGVHSKVRTAFFRRLQDIGSCFYEEPLFWLRAPSGVYDEELHAAFESSWRLVDRPEDAALHVAFGQVESPRAPSLTFGADGAYRERPLASWRSLEAEAEAALAAFSRRRCLSARLAAVTVELAALPSVPLRIHAPRGCPAALRFQVSNPHWVLEEACDAAIGLYLQQRLEARYDNRWPPAKQRELWRFLKLQYEGGCCPGSYEGALELRPSDKMIVGLRSGLLACAPGLGLFRAAVDFALEPASGSSASWRATTQFLLGYPLPRATSDCLLEAVLRLCPHIQYV